MTNPYTSLAHALTVARDTGAITRIVLLPGEYTGAMTLPKSNFGIYSYNYADSADHPPSRVFVNDMAARGAFYINTVNGITLAGLDFYGAQPDYSTTAAR